MDLDGAFFREIHRADELGSGLRKMMRYGKAYGGADPEMIEAQHTRFHKQSLSPEEQAEQDAIADEIINEILREEQQE